MIIKELGMFVNDFNYLKVEKVGINPVSNTIQNNGQVELQFEIVKTMEIGVNGQSFQYDVNGGNDFILLDKEQSLSLYKDGKSPASAYFNYLQKSEESGISSLKDEKALKNLKTLFDESKLNRLLKKEDLFESIELDEERMIIDELIRIGYINIDNDCSCNAIEDEEIIAEVEDEEIIAEVEETDVPVEPENEESTDVDTTKIYGDNVIVETKIEGTTDEHSQPIIDRVT